MRTIISSNLPDGFDGNDVSGGIESSEEYGENQQFQSQDPSRNSPTYSVGPYVIKPTNYTYKLPSKKSMG
ncbi:MAG TPA: hypothetical protein VIM70_07650 [Clostridium sp.]|uniref:hypothetical protein n=1 Tax=Clostridium sp. TaxID=1506 RepID=UPI002F9281BB